MRNPAAMANRLVGRGLGRRGGEKLAWGKRAASAPGSTVPSVGGLPARASATGIDLEPRRRALAARVAELQWDLGGLVYEMATRDHIRIDVLVQRAAALQEVDSELAEVERVLRMETTGAAGACPACEALHSRGAAYCWQCGQALIVQVPSQAIAGRPDP